MCVRVCVCACTHACALFSFCGARLTAGAEQCISGHGAKVVSGLIPYGLVLNTEEIRALESNGPGLHSSPAFY